VQVSEQILQLLCVQFLAVPGHLIAAQANDIADPIVVGGQAAQWEILSLEHSFEARAFLAARGVGLVTAGALGIKDFSPGGLLGIKPKLRVGLTALDVT